MEEGVTSLFEEEVMVTQLIPGVEGIPSGEETTVETELSSEPENQTAQGTEVFPTDVSLLSGRSSTASLSHDWYCCQTRALLK